MLNKFIYLTVFSLVVSALSLGAPALSKAEEAAQGHHIVYISPHHNGHSNPFWLKFESMLKDSISDLGDSLTIINTTGDGSGFSDAVKHIVTMKDKPDIVIYPGLWNRGYETLRIFEKAQIKNVLVNFGLTDGQYKEAGAPGEKFKYWIADIMPDEEHAGYLLAQELYREAKTRGITNEDGKVRFIGISADNISRPSVGRVAGLRKFISEHDDTELVRIIPAAWDERIAEEKLRYVIKRGEAFDALWVLSANMWTGAREALKKTGLTPGKDLVTGDIDWSEQDLKDIENDDLTVSIGGHYYDGAWTAVMMHDYLSGVEFGEEGTMIKTKMSAVNKQTLNALRETLGDERSRINFAQRSKAMNPELKSYNLSPFAD